MRLEEMIKNGFNITAKVNDTEFRLVYIDENSEFFPKKFLVQTKQDDETAWDIIGEEEDFKEAELCFITEVMRYRDLSCDHEEE